MNENNISTPRLILCNSLIFFNKELNDTDIRIFAIIQTLAFKKGYCYASDSYINNLTGKSKRTIQRSLEKLKKQKYIYIVKNGLTRRIYPFEEYILKFRDKNIIEIDEEYDWLNE